MRNNIRWMLTEAKVSELNPNEVNIEGNKLICYHLTSHRSWATHDLEASRMLSNPANVGQITTIYPTDTRSDKIVKNLKNINRVQKTTKSDLEEFIIMNMIDDPYTNTSGFTAGGGDYHGKGLYTCYTFNPEIAKTYGDICLAFEIDISKFLICAEDLAKKVHGENWKIKDQIIKCYSLNQKDPEKIEKLKKLLNSLEYNEFKMSANINSKESRENKTFTADISQSIIRYFGKENVSGLYDGVILYGRGDGPVCVSFYPKYDSKLIGLGRLDKNKSNIVDWYDSINDFVGGTARNKLDFETMNDIAEENSDKSELTKSKDSEIKKFDPTDVSVKSLFDSRDIFKVLAFYETETELIKDKIESYFVENNIYFTSILNFPNKEIPTSVNTLNMMFLNIVKKFKTSGNNNITSKEVLHNLILSFATKKIKLSNEIVEFCLEFIFSKEYAEDKSGYYDGHIAGQQDECIIVYKDYIKDFTLNKELEKFINDKFNSGGKSAEAIFKRNLHDIENYYITSRKLTEFIESITRDHFLSRIKNSLSISDIKKFILSLLRYYTNSKRKMPAKVSNFVLTNVHHKDIVLSKQEQDNWTNKIGKSHHYVKKMFSSYKNVDPDVFIKLIEPDLIKGGMGSGIVYSDFHVTYNIYSLLYKHKSIVDLFARSCKSGELRSIIKSITNSLEGETVEVLNNTIPLDDGSRPDSNYGSKHNLNSIIDLNDSQWFNYFLDTMRTSPSIKMIKNPLNELEKVMKVKNMISDGDVATNNLDLSHKIIIGKTFKEVYSF